VNLEYRTLNLLEQQYTLSLDTSAILSSLKCRAKDIDLDFYRTMLCVSAVFAVARCPFVCHVRVLYSDG